MSRDSLVLASANLRSGFIGELTSTESTPSGIRVDADSQY
jgi:hypothetical protein